MLIPVILSGGAGTRLWPVSRASYPKPFITLGDGENLLQKTLLRALDLPDVCEVLTVTNRDYFFQSRDVCTAVRRRCSSSVELSWLLEPEGRNTAPAIACAALQLRARYGEDAVMLVLPADHLIEDHERFAASVGRAVALASDGYLVTFGVSPVRPETGFGYIEAGEPLGAGHQIRCFVEKPDLPTAEQMLASGQFFWNSGMFCFRVDAVLNELAQHAPAVLTAAEACCQLASADQPVALDVETFHTIPEVSFDYAVMEHTERAAVVVAGFDWNDIGSWEAMAGLCPADEAGNRTDGDSLIVDSRNCYLRSEDRLIAAVGLDDLLVIDTADALLVAHRGRAQDVKQVASQLKKLDHTLYRLHRTVHRPWGTYTVLEEGDHFKIKRIVVKPGASLSSQMHYHRNEHWIVVSGTARISQGDTSRLLLTNQSTYIEAGTRHRLENPGLTDLVMIEVQSGQYLGEDDIVRFEDMYGRS